LMWATVLILDGSNSRPQFKLDPATFQTSLIYNIAWLTKKSAGEALFRLASRIQLGCDNFSGQFCHRVHRGRLIADWSVERATGVKEGHTVCPLGGVGKAEASITLKFGMPCTLKVESSTPPFSNGAILAEHIGWNLINIR
jgi:hypothetical protein